MGLAHDKGTHNKGAVKAGFTVKNPTDWQNLQPKRDVAAGVCFPRNGEGSPKRDTPLLINKRVINLIVPFQRHTADARNTESSEVRGVSGWMWLRHFQHSGPPARPFLVRLFEKRLIPLVSVWLQYPLFSKRACLCNPRFTP